MDSTLALSHQRGDSGFNPNSPSSTGGDSGFNPKLPLLLGERLLLLRIVVTLGERIASWSLAARQSSFFARCLLLLGGICVPRVGPPPLPCTGRPPWTRRAVAISDAGSARQGDSRSSDQTTYAAISCGGRGRAVSGADPWARLVISRNPRRHRLRGETGRILRGSNGSGSVSRSGQRAGQFSLRTFATA